MENKTLMTLLKELKACEELTVREHKWLPDVSGAVSSNNMYVHERIVAGLLISEIEKILAMARKYLYNKDVTRDLDKGVLPLECGGR